MIRSEIMFRNESIFAGSFTETDVNDGTVTGSITATLDAGDDTFAADVVTSNYVSATTIPDGLNRRVHPYQRHRRSP